VLIKKDFLRPTPITFAARELIAELKSGPRVLVRYDPMRGPQTTPIGNGRRIRPETKVYQVPREYEVSMLLATRCCSMRAAKPGPIPALVRWRTKTVGAERCRVDRKPSLQKRAPVPVRGQSAKGSDV